MVWSYRYVVADVSCSPDAYQGLLPQPRTEEVFHFLGVLMDIQTIAMDMQPLKFYKFPGGKEVLATCWVIEPEESTPARPFVCHVPYDAMVRLTRLYRRTGQFRYLSTILRPSYDRI